MVKDAHFLIIGAGPFGLAMAAYAHHSDMDYLVVGRPMEFWKSNMPKDLILRSACDWHLDPVGIHTIEHYLRASGQSPKDVEPLSLQFYLGYADWFQQQKRINILPAYVERLNRLNSGFEAVLEDGTTLRAKKVLLAVGFGYFKNLPADLMDILPAGSFSHTCDLVEFAEFRGKRCLIIGGRQSAYEWAALLNEAGASAVDVSHRHETPEFKPSNWSWVKPMVDGMVTSPAWYRNLPAEQREEVNQRFWAEGRLKLEPWLKPRIVQDSVKIWPKSQVVSCQQLPAGEFAVRLDTGGRADSVAVDHVVLATGYKVDMAQIPFLSRGNILESLETRGGHPVLDKRFQSNVPGLFITSMAATQDFGPFLAFTVSVGAAARIIAPGLGR
jgi:cation diffusion facilitator CzcD-associated flavoprotein CzcO